MSDLFHVAVPDDFIANVWSVMARCPQHHFQVLTKRPERLAAMSRRDQLRALPNVWIGTSVENAEVVDRVAELVTIPAMTRFVSFEPLIGSVGDIDLAGVHWAIVGGESGPRSRPMERLWVEEIQRICTRDQVAFFFKQWGGANKKSAGRTLNGRTYDDYPQELAA